MAAAMPLNEAANAHTMAMTATPNTPGVESFARTVRISERQLTGPLPIYIASVKRMLSPSLADSLDKAVVELLEKGDPAVNGPSDLVKQLLKLNIPGRLRSGLESIQNRI